jgi:acetolactate synthase-1/2/3 large subunit
MKLAGTDIFWECMVREGVEVIFGYPGGVLIPLLDAMLKYPIHFVLTRHEQGAAHAADGYARASGKVGVAMATSGPGATNLVTGIATAMMDSIPTVFYHWSGTGILSGQRRFSRSGYHWHYLADYKT